MKVSNSSKNFFIAQELIEAFYDLYVEFKKIDKKYNSLKMDHFLLTNEFDTLKNAYDKYNFKSFILCIRCENSKSFHIKHKKKNKFLK